MVLLSGINEESHSSGWQTADSFVCLPVNYASLLSRRWVDIPDQKGPVGIDDTDPCFVDWVRDIIEDSWVRIESFDWDLFQLESFAALLIS